MATQSSVYEMVWLDIFDMYFAVRICILYIYCFLYDNLLLPNVVEHVKAQLSTKWTIFSTEMATCCNKSPQYKRTCSWSLAQIGTQVKESAWSRHN